MRLFILLLVLSLNAQSSPIVEEQGSFTILATSGARAIDVRFFFSQPFTSMPTPGCSVDIVKPSRQGAGHGIGEVKEHSLMWVEVFAEVGEQVTWTCRGTR